MTPTFHYCACIRTLGTAGEKYLSTLQSLQNQSIKPDKIIVYIAEGYPLPKETIGLEEYVRVKKGFIAQRALPYDEVTTPYILLLDDDVAFDPDTVERISVELLANGGDCIVSNRGGSYTDSATRKLLKIWSSFVFPMHSNRWGIRIRKSGAFSYNNNPKKSVYETQSGIGYFSLWKKDSLLGIHFDDEVYFDRFRYCLGDDQLMFNKAHKNGYKCLATYDVGAHHLDAGSGHVKENPQKYEELGAINYLIWNRSCHKQGKLDGGGMSSVRY